MAVTPDSERTRLSTTLSAALATRSREAFTALLIEDVHWGGERGGNECIDQVAAGDHYTGLIATGLSLHLTELHGDQETWTATMHVTHPDPAEDSEQCHCGSPSATG